MACMPCWTLVSPSVAKSTVVGRCWIFCVQSRWPQLGALLGSRQCPGLSNKAPEQPKQSEQPLDLKGCECIRWRSSFCSRRCTNELYSCKVRARPFMQTDIELSAAKALLGSWSLLRGGCFAAAGKVCHNARMILFQLSCIPRQYRLCWCAPWVRAPSFNSSSAEHSLQSIAALQIRCSRQQCKQLEQSEQRKPGHPSVTWSWSLRTFPRASRTCRIVVCELVLL